MAEYRNLKEKAYTIIKSKILNNELKPNQYLEEKMLCEELEISRTPIREAINTLAWEDLVQIIPKKGIFVTNISVQMIQELFQMRHLLEPIALKMAFPRLDREKLAGFRAEFAAELERHPVNYLRLHELDYEFHNYLISNCSNSYLIKMMNNISDNFQRVRTQPFYEMPRTETGAQEHITLIDLLLEGNVEEAQKVLDEHITSTEKYYIMSQARQ